MADSAQIVDLKVYRETHSPEPISVVRQTAVVRVDDDSQQKKRELLLEDLYGSDTPTGGVIVRARELLADMAQRTNAAHLYLSDGDMIGADQEINLLQADLPELFCCRELSEGLATLTVALHFALLNRKDQVLSQDQLYVVRKCVELVYQSPFINFDTALDLVEELKSVGLVTDPPEAEILSDILAPAESTD
jgi:hypothetical protein